ncbi:pentapeptide repeat-containing protein [Photorhabdus sp. SF281]|uniref:pentapeptide repeat-containing protein n=1 Tax=Photorhabdus sp. SF281 TaxID=3459527 RepID=UPI004043EA08
MTKKNELEMRREIQAEIFNSLIQSEKKIENTKIYDCEFQNCNFSSSTLKNCKIIDCKFENCNLSLMDIDKTIFNNVEFYECKMIGINWTKANFPKFSFESQLKFEKCKMNDSSFYGLILKKLNLIECSAQGVDFREGDFSSSNFIYSNFSRSLFNNTNLAKTNFSEAQNYFIDIYKNNITGATFTRFDALGLLDCLDINLVD